MAILSQPHAASSATKGLLAEPAQLLRRSRALASMLPSLVLSGVITLVVSAVMRMIWMGAGNDFFGAWMEAWLTSWPIAFPFAYLLSPVLRRLATLLSAPAAAAKPQSGWIDMNDVAARATTRNGLTVLRRSSERDTYAA